MKLLGATSSKYGYSSTGEYMSQQGTFDRIVAALHDAALDDTLWPSASALIDEAVGMAGSHLVNR